MTAIEALPGQEVELPCGCLAARVAPPDGVKLKFLIRKACNDHVPNVLQLVDPAVDVIAV